MPQIETLHATARSLLPSLSTQPSARCVTASASRHLQEGIRAPPLMRRPSLEKSFLLFRNSILVVESVFRPTSPLLPPRFLWVGRRFPAACATMRRSDFCWAIAPSFFRSRDYCFHRAQQISQGKAIRIVRYLVANTREVTNRFWASLLRANSPTSHALRRFTQFKTADHL